MGDVAEITVGPSQLFLAPIATALPTLTGALTDFGAFDSPGFTQDGIEWDYTATWKDIMVDELMGPAKKILVAHKLIVTAKLAQTTLKNFAYAVAGATLVAPDNVTIGSVDTAPEY